MLELLDLSLLNRIAKFSRLRNFD